MLYGALFLDPDGGGKRKFHDGTRSTAICQVLPMRTHGR